MSERTYYRHGAWLVTSERFSTRYKDYAMAEIRAIEVSRLPLVMMTLSALAAGAATAALSPLLFTHEIVVVLAVCATGIIGAWNCAWITVKGDAWRGENARLFALWPRAQAVRVAINQALAERAELTGAS